MTRLLFIASLLSLTACAPSMQTMQGSHVFDELPRTEAEEQARNQEALDSLLAQAEANAGDEHYDAPVVIPLRLEPTTAEALNEETVRRSALDAFLRSGPYSVFGVVSLVPARADGVLLGFQIEDVFQGGEYIIEGGLERGDIVRTVNGTSVLNPDDVMVIWDDLAEATSLDVVYLRGGVEQTLHYDIVSDVAAID